MAIIFHCFFKTSAILKSVTNIDQRNLLEQITSQPFSVRAEMLSTHREVPRTRHVRYRQEYMRYGMEGAV
jgi:hypothetical protein